MDMRQDALKQVKDAFAEGKEDIFAAMEVISDVLAYTIKEGPIALSKEECFRKKGEPYVLDAIERTGKKIPLKKYLAYALDRISYGDEIAILAGFMENKYYANAYIGEAAYIAFIYWIAIIGIVQGIPFVDILEHFRSVIPDAEETSFEIFASKWKTGEKSTKNEGTVILFEQDKK